MNKAINYVTLNLVLETSNCTRYLPFINTSMSSFKITISH